MEGFTFDSDGEGERPAAVVPGTEATGSKDAPDDDVDSGGDIKAVKKKKTPAKTLVGVLWDYITFVSHLVHNLEWCARTSTEAVCNLLKCNVLKVWEQSSFSDQEWETCAEGS